VQETEQVLKRELGLEGASQMDTSSSNLPPVPQSDTEPTKYQESYSSLLEFVERSLDMYRVRYVYLPSLLDKVSHLSCHIQWHVTDCACIVCSSSCTAATQTGWLGFVPDVAKNVK
jgi:hypothetical protein